MSKFDLIILEMKYVRLKILQDFKMLVFILLYSHQFGQIQDTNEIQSSIIERS